MFSESKKRIRFVAGGFSTPVLGNVWEGREAVLPKKTAQRFIELGHADEIDEKGNVIQKAKQLFQEPDTGTAPPADSGKGVKFVKTPDNLKVPEPETPTPPAEDDGEGAAADGVEPKEEIVAAEGQIPGKRGRRKKK